MRILRCRYLYERVYVKTYCIFSVAYIGEMFLGDLLKLPTIVCWVHMTQGALAIKCLPSWETRHDFSIRLPVDKDHVKKKDVSFYPSSDWAVHTTFNQSKWCSITILSPPYPPLFAAWYLLFSRSAHLQLFAGGKPLTRPQIPGLWWDFHGEIFQGHRRKNSMISLSPAWQSVQYHKILKSFT